MGKLNQDSFVVDEVLTALVGEGEKESKKDSKKDKKSNDKKDKKSKDKKSGKKDKEIKIANNDKADTDGDIIDIEIVEITSSDAAKKATGNYVPEKDKGEQSAPKGIKTADNKVILFTKLIQSIGETSPNKMARTVGDDAFVAFVEWAIENKHSVPTEYLEKSIEIKDAAEEKSSEDKKSKDKKKDKKSKDKKSKDKKKDKKKKSKDKDEDDKKSKKKKSKKDKDEDKKSKKKDKKKGKKKDKKKFKLTTDDDDIARAFKTAKKRDKAENAIMTDEEIDGLTTIEIDFDL